MQSIEDEFHRGRNRDRVALKLTNSSLWPEKPLAVHRGLSLVENNWTTLEEYLNQIDSGRPNEQESDNCLDTALFSSCESSKDACEDIMDVTQRSYGYRATHKLLYWIVIAQMNCKSPFDDIGKICRDIYGEFRFLWIALPDNLYLMDLFMEQLLLCGLMGFSEFVEEKYLKFISHWIHSLKCADNPFCNDHTLGVALAVECLTISMEIN